MNYRQKICVKVITFPEGFDEEDRLGCKTPCCVSQLKLASTTDDDNYKNDITGIPIKTSDVTDIVDFVIEKCGNPIPLPNLGEILVAPQDDLLVGFIFDWKQYLIAYGVGEYKITVNFTISGVTGGYLYGQYDLKNYSVTNAMYTSRIWSEYNSFFQRELMDFTNSNFKDSVRFFGTFGTRQPETEINQLITKGRKSEKITRENLNKWTLNTDPLSIDITRQLLNWHFLNEDVCLMSDHNKYNHDYLLFDIPVVLQETATVEYLDKDRGAKITAIFGDRKKLDKSYYNLQ